MTKIIAANWKMHKTAVEAVEFAQVMREIQTDNTIIVCAPSTILFVLKGEFGDLNMSVGAQNIHFEQSGAFTGEVSADMIKEFAQYTLVGHSERRQLFGETNEDTNKKIKAALTAGLKVIFCVGETEEQRTQNQTEEVLKAQVTEGLAGIDTSNVVIAYEPIWAIGTGNNATPEQANEVHTLIKSLANIPVLYGGSVKPDNAQELLSQPNIDGVLVGGASLDAQSFKKIIESA